MLRIGKMADYALLITNHLVSSNNQLQTTETLAKATYLPVTTVRKLLKQLVDAGIVNSYRGIKGGYVLAQNPEVLSVADVVVAIEGPISLTECSTDKGECNLTGKCRLKTNWNYLNVVVSNILKQISLADMSKKMSGKYNTSIPF